MISAVRDVLSPFELSVFELFDLKMANLSPEICQNHQIILVDDLRHNAYLKPKLELLLI